MADIPETIPWNAGNLNDGQGYERKILLYIAASLSKNKDVKDFWIVSNPVGIDKIDDVVVRISFTNRKDIVLFLQSKLAHLANTVLWLKLQNAKKPVKKCFDIDLKLYEKAFSDIIKTMSSNQPQTKPLRKLLHGVRKNNYFVCIFTNMETSDPALQVKQFNQWHPIYFLNTRNPGEYRQFQSPYQNHNLNSIFYKRLYVFLEQADYQGMDSAIAQILGEEYKERLVNLDDCVKNYMQQNKKTQPILTKLEFEIKWFKVLVTSHWMHISSEVEQIAPKFEILWQKIFENQELVMNLREEIWPLLAYQYQSVIRRNDPYFDWKAKYNENVAELKDLLFSLWRNGKIPLPIRSDCTQQLVKFVKDFKTVNGGFVVFNSEGSPEVITHIKDIPSDETLEEVMKVEVSLQGRPPVTLSAISDGDPSITDKLKISQVLSWTKNISPERHIVGRILPKPDDNFITRSFTRKQNKEETQSTGQIENLEKNHPGLSIVDKYGKKSDTDSKKILTMDDVLRIITPGLHIITAAPGMGKSTVLQELAYNYSPQDFVIFIKLRDCLMDIEKEDNWSRIQTDPIEYFFKKAIDNTDDGITHSIFQSHKTRERLFICLDGFDEILPCHGERISSLLTTILGRFAIPVVCTTRPHGEEQITKKLNTTCLELSSLTFEQIKQYLMKIVDDISIIWKFDIEFLSNPLHLNMISQIYKQTKNPTSLTKGNMYKTFVKIKHEVYNEKIGLSANHQSATGQTDKSMKNHRKIALVEIFGKECVISHGLTKDDKFKNILKYINKHNIGIVDVRNSNGAFSFIHRTFAEYFVADWLLQMATEENSNKDNLKYFFEKVVDNHSTIRSMINELSKYSAIWSKAINNLCVGCDIFKLDEFGRNFAHIVEHEDGEFGFMHYSNYQMCISRLLFRKDALLQWTPMQHQFSYSSENVAEEINEHCPKCVPLLENHADSCTDLLTAIDSEKNEDVSNILKSQEFLLETGLGIVALHSAITTGNESIVRLLLDLRPVLLNEKDPFGNTALHIACAFGCRNIVELILEKQANLDIRNETDGYSPLDVAAAEGHTNVVSLLVDHIRNGNGVGRDSSSIKLNSKMFVGTLNAAVTEGRLDVVTWLIYNCADPTLSDDSGWTAMHCAVQKEQLEILELLLQRELNVDARTNEGETPLHIASFSNNAVAARFFLEHRADPALTDGEGWTTLHSAAQKGQLEILTLLLERGLYVDAKTIQGKTPLHIASSNNNAVAARFFLKHRADPQLTDDKGWTPLHSAAQKGQLEILTLLLETGLSVDAKTNQEETPLHIACATNNSVAARFFLEHSADPTLTNANRGTAMHYAALRGQLEILTLLLERGLNVDAKDDDGTTPLQQAAYDNNADAVHFFLEHGANLALTDDSRLTAIHYAAKGGCLQFVIDLSERGLDINSKTTAGETPLAIARKHGHSDVIDWLVKNGAEEATMEES